MKDDRLRVPIDDPYLYAIGLAVFCFAKLEWNAVWCCEKIQSDYIPTIAAQRKAAGVIAGDLVRLASTHHDPVVRVSLGAGASDFAALVRRRNDLLHATPGTARSGHQRMYRKGVEWTIPMIDDLADECVHAGGVLNHHLHQAL